jgi:hypothetical protein
MNFNAIGQLSAQFTMNFVFDSKKLTVLKYKWLINQLTQPKN